MTTLDRRTFLGTVGVAVLAARPTFAASLKRVGVQLYTVRTDLEKDFDRTLPQVRNALKKHGLTSPAAHLDFPTVSTPDKWAKALDGAAVMGQTFIVNPWIDETLRKEPGIWQRVADVYNTAGAAAARHGIQFCYHNHNFEFYPREDAGGKLPMDVLLESCDPKLVQIELDLCWISAA